MERSGFGWIFFRISGWTPGYWRGSLSRAQDRESERAMGRSGRESERAEVPAPGDSESHGFPGWGMRHPPGRDSAEEP